MAGRILVLRNGGKKRYDMFVCATNARVRKRWTPKIDGEHSDYRWVTIDWCVARGNWLHPVLYSLLEDDQARETLAKVLNGKRGFKERVDRWTDGICLRPEPGVV